MPEVLRYYLNLYVSILGRFNVKYSWDKMGIEDILRKHPDIAYYVGFHVYDTVKYYKAG